MNTMTPAALLEQLQWRYATKEFDSAKCIPEDIWKKIEESLVITPSSFGLQPWKFVCISDQPTKESLLENSWHQRQVTDCSHMVVLCAKDHMDPDDINHWLDRLCEVRGVTRDTLEGYAGMMTGFFANMSAEQVSAWAKNQVYIALGQLMTTAAVMGIDACPMEGIVPAEYDRILGLDGSGFSTSVGCAMGYRSDGDKYAELPKVRYSSDRVIENI
ncbi:MAG: NAD(P)H-dependent oxidoreductase [Akkermansiaceae bacterium]